MALTSLPNELLFHSASYLCISSLNALLQTNRDLNYLLTPILYARALDPAISEDVLRWAVGHNSLVITKFLLANNVFATTAAELCDDACYSLVQLAAARGFVSIVRAFMEHDPSLNLEAHKLYLQVPDQSPMMLAAENGHLNVVRLFTDHYMSFEWENYPAFTKHDMDFYRPLKLAITNFHRPIIRFLLHHLNLEYRSRIFRHAAAAGSCELLAELLPLLTNHRHEAVADGLRVSATNGHLRCVEQLVEHVGQIEWKRALQAAARAGHDGVVVYLVELFEDQAEASTVALYDAVMGGSRDVVNLLLAYGCDVKTSLKIPGGNIEAIFRWMAHISGRQVGIDSIGATALEARADRYPGHRELRFRHRLMTRYPPKGNAPDAQRVWGSYSGVQKALRNGKVYAIASNYRQAHVQFVEAPRWF